MSDLPGCPVDCGGCSCHINPPCHHCIEHGRPPEEPFTDDDLNLLKAETEEAISDEISVSLSGPRMADLIARLDVAEANMGGHSRDCPREIGKCICTKEARDKAWRKQAGK